jgi:hypothetical protein
MVLATQELAEGLGRPGRMRRSDLFGCDVHGLLEKRDLVDDVGVEIEVGADFQVEDH